MKLLNRMKTNAGRGVIGLIFGSAGGQMLTVVASPVISRLVDPSDYGIYVWVFSLSVVVAATSTLRYEYALPLARSEDDVRALLRVSLLLPVAFAVLASSLIAILHRPLEGWTGLDLLPDGLWLGPLVLATAWFSVFSQLAVRDQAYTAIASRTFLQGAGTAVAQVGSAFIAPSGGGLLAGLLVGRTLGISTLARRYWHLTRGVKRRSVRSTSRAFAYFPAVLAPSALLNTLGTNLPVLLIASWYGPGIAGQLGITQRIVLAPTALVSVAVGQVFSGELARRLREGQTNNRQLYLRTTLRLGAMATALLLTLLVIVPPLIHVVLGPGWDETGALTRAIALSTAAGFVVSPLSYVFIAYTRAAMNIGIDISRVVLIGGAGATAFFVTDSAVTATWLLFGGLFITYIITWWCGLSVVSPGRSRTRSDEGAVAGGTETPAAAPPSTPA